MTRNGSAASERVALKAPTEIETDRLLLRKPKDEDAAAIFDRYAGDREVCRYLAWPMHRSIDDTKAFVEFSESQWKRWPAGPFLIFDRSDGELLGSTGLGFELPHRASTGYVLARNYWGNGYATEALVAMRDTASGLGVVRLFAYCHPDHRPSARVLEKAGFTLEGTLRRYCEFPNLELGVAKDVVCYSCILGS